MIRKIAISIGVLAALLGVAFIFTLVAVKPLSTDLSMVGQGRPALVLAYENYSPAGAAALERLRHVKGDYEMRVDFLVADLGTPQGRAFAERHDIDNGVAVFLRQDGRPLRVTTIPADEEDLRRRLDGKLAEVEGL
ncbi:MAG: hypothetical protein U5S82_02935 [Gammaproteobacteria bacterium]|nr:hypothetical protein [Gammaproteobacteria bacterium]